MQNHFNQIFPDKKNPQIFIDCYSNRFQILRDQNDIYYYYDGKKYIFFENLNQPIIRYFYTCKNEIFYLNTFNQVCVKQNGELIVLQNKVNLSVLNKKKMFLPFWVKQENFFQYLPWI